ncbi:hypothetical protein [Paenibacillus assamensis]|uniref:hypothetical protein n=1 Tax=Paenibacillus assamensis TaxID=311244 RepID=UPI0004092E03|nr:hypothetical protein [Paenibacillus assamensis]
MVGASTWFSPYAFEVLDIPLGILVGTLFAWTFKKIIIGPLIHLAVSVLCYLFIWIYFYSVNTTEFLTKHMIDLEGYIIQLFFVSVTWVSSYAVVTNSKLKNKKNEER